jgi:bacterioferritin (cytochrome b1)
MLLTRDEMTYDFGGGKLDPVRDKQLLEWMLNQFLYGEVTGIQVGHWLYDAPDLEAARFLARQALEEMQHVDNFLRIMTMLGCRPQPAHPAVRFLATGMMGGSWAEHVALEMAQGEGFVLQAFYAVIDTLDHKPSVDILRRAVKQEERHVEFGEQQTAKAIEGRPWLRRRLLGLSLVSMWGVRRLTAFMEKRLPADHPVLTQLPSFLEHANRCAELRLRRIGVLDRPLAEISGARRALLVAEAYGGKLLGGVGSVLMLPLRVLPFWPKKKRLTDTYLADAHITGYALPAGDPEAPPSLSEPAS